MSVLWSFMLLSILLLYGFINCVGSSGSITTFGNETDHFALIAFKNGIERDPFRALSSWNDSLHFCNWHGVSCSRRHHQRVMALDLSLKSLVGSLSSQIGNLSFLRTIILSNNSFHSKIPQEIGRLFRLRSLILRNNSFEGEIPTNLTRCSDLRDLNLYYNNLAGKIPLELSALSKLDRLSLSSNNFIGSIPPSLGNLSSLTRLSLGRNSLEGMIPEDIGRIGGLRFLQTSENKLTGMIPSSLYNLSSVNHFAVSGNELHGSLPLDIGITLPNLKFLRVSANLLTGPIPYTLSNASGLEYIQINKNYFTGPVPGDLGRLRGLSIVNLQHNRLGSREGDDLSFISSLTNSTRLRVICFGDNLLRGSLPNSIANLSIQAQSLILGRNQIYGSIPSGIASLIKLNTLDLSRNSLTGSIPAVIGRLHRLFLNDNRFSGPIPSSFGNLTLLNILNLDNNNLDGHIPPSLGDCQDLSQLSLSYNNLNGTIPKEVIGLSSISIIFVLAHNVLTGSLPLEVGNLKNLGELDVSNNKLSGIIPNTLGNCVRLERLYLEGNFFEGEIPQALRSLRGIQVLDISRNNFSRQIPKFLGEFLVLHKLNMSFNVLEGEVLKTGIFQNASAISIIGNNNLCGGIPELKLPTCLIHGSKGNEMSLVIRVLSPVIAVILCLIVLACFLIVRCHKRMSRKKDSSSPSFKHHNLRISYAELLKATDDFSEANLIGVGSYSSVYKGILDQVETLVAVKVLSLQQRGASKSFISECKALKNIRHRNLLKILSACSSVDFQGNDFKALVFEFMPKGSLEKWLHPEEEADGEQDLRNLSLSQRMNVAIDVASALEYLHHHTQATIIHSDLKPSNVLLDDDMTAHVGDFGLAKVLSSISTNVSQNQSSCSVVIKGSIGYVAPEYGMGSMVSPKGDVYSYGILLLEMFTGKRPTDEMFKEDLSLHNFVKMALPERVMEIKDPRLLLEEDLSGRMQDCLVSILRIGIACSMEMPKDRMEMGDVLRELTFLKD